MDVLYFLDSFPKLSKSFVLNEIRGLEKLGHRVAVFSLTRPDDELTHTEYDELEATIGYASDPTPGALTRYFIDRRTFSGSLFAGVDLSSPRSIFSSPFLANQCIEFLEDIEFRPDHVHGHFLNWRRLAAVRVARTLDVPVSVTTHAYDLYRDTTPDEVRRLSNRFDRVITISQYNRRYLTDIAETKTPISVVHAGINVEKFQSETNSVPYRILTVARLTEKKGIEFAIRSVSRIKDSYPDLEYHIVGSGDKEFELRSLVNSLGLQDTVSFLGSVSDKRLLEEYAEAEVFLLPSVVTQDGDRDGIPVALMEAMASNTVPVSTNISGIPELITDGVNGVLVPPRSVGALTDALNKLYQDEPTQREIRKRSPDIVKQEFDTATSAADTQEVFESLAEKRR